MRTWTYPQVASFPTHAYITNVSAALDVPASSVRVKLYASVVAATSVEVANDAAEAARIANKATTAFGAGALGDSCTAPVINIVVAEGGGVTGDPHFMGAHSDVFAP